MLLVKNILFLFLNISVFNLLTISEAQSESSKEQIAFYKSKNSPFPSGEIGLSELKRTQINSESELVKYETKYYLYGQQKISTQLMKPTFANELNLTNNNQDTGYFQTMTETQLKNSPDSKAKNIMPVPMGQKLVPLKYAKGFIQVQLKNRTGYIDISHCISKFDFAYAVFAVHPQTKLKQWHYVKSRLFDQIEITDGNMIPLSSIIGLSVHNNIGITTQNNSLLPLWSKVKLQFEKKSATPTQTQWFQSKLKKLGIVWWKENSPNNKKENLNARIDFDTLIKKEIYSTSFLAENPKKSIVSTQSGVYITDDGSIWKKIEQFENFKGPVFYYNSNMIFVGSFRSLDQGKTFQQFVNINTLSQQLKNTLGYNPRAVKIQKISSQLSSKITFDVLADSRKLKIQSQIYNQEWKIIR